MPRAIRLAEWLIEAGIGETRAALAEGDRILEARIIPDGELIAGTVVEARLVARIPERGQSIVAWDGHEALVSPLPVGVTEGALTRVEIVRPAIPEPGKPKRAHARPSDTEPAPAPSLDGHVLRHTDPDLLEAAGWSELLEEAASGVIAFPGGELRIALTPAMTLIDVDGTLASAPLAIAGARAAAEAIRRLDIAGSIGIDLPAGADKAVRHAAAEAIDAALPPPFERTAVNGFGFVQIVRPRRRRSLPEIHMMEPALAHARALLRRAERTSGAGARTLTAHPAVIAAIAPGWREELARRLGTEIVLREDASLTMSGGHVQAQFA